jgi:hypothetical protein
MRKRAERRLRALETDALLDFIEADTGALGRGLRDWRATREVACLHELEMTTEIHLFAVRELIRRSQIQVSG